MEPITVILLNKGNDLENALKSVATLHPKQILLGTFVSIKPQFKEVVIIELEGSNSEGLNKLQDLAQTDWILYLKDNESLLQFNEYMPNLIIKTKEIYGFQILQDEVIMKEPRLWNKKEHKVVFKNPVFEKPGVEPTKIIDVTLYQQKVQDSNINKDLDLWKKTTPLSVDATYYKAFAALAQKDFKGFKRIINHYLFSVQKKDIPSVMARYYLALVEGIVENETNSAIQNIVMCLAENPLMAEFWCLLGDIFIKIGKFDHAIQFYDNAIILGCRRQQLDFWPMHIPKYGDYPKDMIEKCKKAVSSATTYTT